MAGKCDHWNGMQVAKRLAIFHIEDRKMFNTFRHRSCQRDNNKKVISNIKVTIAHVAPRMWLRVHVTSQKRGKTLVAARQHNG